MLGRVGIIQKIKAFEQIKNNKVDSVDVYVKMQKVKIIG